VLTENPQKVADVGCGTGVLGIAALLFAPYVHALLLDVDVKACEAAKDNLKRLGLEDRCEIVCEDAEKGLINQKLDLIVANLPFVPSDEVQLLPARFRDFVPRIAVDGGVNGLNLFSKLSDALSNAMYSGGKMVLQFGGGQRQAVLNCLGRQWREHPDDSLGYPNVMVVERLT
jgi:release factor glutamine methyltransferase